MAIGWFSAGLALLSVAADAGPARISPARVFNGAPLLIEVESERAPQGKWLGHELSFALDPKLKRWTALAGVPLDTKPGLYKLTLTRGGEAQEQAVHVEARAYRESIVTVAPRYLEPPDEEKARIEEERELKKKVFAARSDRKWSAPFRSPTGSIQTSPFGVRRTYNGKTQSIHQGLDYRAAVGTPIRAVSAGRVVIARPMYFEGGLVAIDHGEGFFTLYMHLSEFVAKEGDLVTAGQVIAKSGSTGRSAAPHLHLGVQWQGVYLEPATLLALGRAPAASAGKGGRGGSQKRGKSVRPASP